MQYILYTLGITTFPTHLVLKTYLIDLIIILSTYDAWNEKNDTRHYPALTTLSFSYELKEYEYLRGGNRYE